MYTYAPVRSHHGRSARFMGTVAVLSILSFLALPTPSAHAAMTYVKSTALYFGGSQGQDKFFYYVSATWETLGYHAASHGTCRATYYDKSGTTIGTIVPDSDLLSSSSSADVLTWTDSPGTQFGGLGFATQNTGKFPKTHSLSFHYEAVVDLFNASKPPVAISSLEKKSYTSEFYLGH